MRSVMQHTFSQVPQAEIQRSAFNRTHGYKTTFDAGYLVPVFVDEALPGDSFNLDMTAFTRLATPLHPYMDNAYVDSFFFAVPLRLLWQNWEKMNGQQTNPGDTTDYLVPEITAPVGGYAIGSLQDYMGLPTGVAGFKHSALFLRAYNLIYNEWFRDQNLQNSITVPQGDGPDTPTDYVLLRRGKRHDYFTSALPWPQKGPAVSLPLGTVAPVSYVHANTLNWTARRADTGVGYSPAGLEAVTMQTVTGKTVNPANTVGLQFDPAGNLQADLSLATAATINQLRQAFQIQRMYERDARGGTRYTEIIRSHFGVVSPDARLQRPEYLGGGSSPINVSPVVQNSETTVDSPQGNLAAIGTAHLRRHGFTKSFTEHCVIIGMVNIRADLTYQEGLDRMWSRRSRFDFYWPTLAHIGEQTILNKEIYTQGSGNPTADEAAFGYQERYAEYRYKPSRITGEFRSTAPQSLDTWHLGQHFGALPALNGTFIVDNPPFDRVIAVPTEPHMIGDFYFQFRCARPMPVFGVPGLIDHF